MELVPIKALNRRLRLLVVPHLDKTETTGLPGELVSDDVHRGDRTGLAKKCLEIWDRHVKREIAHIQLRCHYNPPKNKKAPEI